MACREQAVVQASEGNIIRLIDVSGLWSNLDTSDLPDRPETPPWWKWCLAMVSHYCFVVLCMTASFYLIIYMFILSCTWGSIYTACRCHASTCIKVRGIWFWNWRKSPSLFDPRPQVAREGAAIFRPIRSFWVFNTGQSAKCDVGQDIRIPLPCEDSFTILLDISLPVRNIERPGRHMSYDNFSSFCPLGFLSTCMISARRRSQSSYLPTPTATICLYAGRFIYWNGTENGPSHLIALSPSLATSPYRVETDQGCFDYPFSAAPHTWWSW